MDAPLIVPSRAWSADQAKAFVDTPLEALGTDTGLPGWRGRGAQIIREIMFGGGLSGDDAGRPVPPLPFPPSAALACMLIARWDLPQDAWNRVLTLRDHHAAKA